MVECKTAVNPLLKLWSCCSLISTMWFPLLLRDIHIESGPWMWCSNVVIDILYCYITEEYGKMWYMSLSISGHSTYIMFRNHDMSRCFMQYVMWIRLIIDVVKTKVLHPCLKNFISVICIYVQYYITSKLHKQRVLMHRHQGWNVRHGLCHIYMRYIYIYIYELFIAFVCFVVCSLL